MSKSTTTASSSLDGWGLMEDLSDDPEVERLPNDRFPFGKGVSRVCREPAALLSTATVSPA